MANKLITTDLGGFPLVLDDLRFLEQAEADSINGMLSAFNGLAGITNSYILAGAEVTVNGLNLDIAEGWIAYNGEVVKVDAHSIVDQGTGATYWWKLEQTFDPAGLKTFQDLSTNDTYEQRRMILTNDVLEAQPPSIFSFNRVTLLSDTLQNLLGRTEWTTIDLESSPNVVANDSTAGTGADTALSVLPAAGSFLKYRIVGKTVHIQYRLVSFRPVPFDTTPAASIKISGLPFIANGTQWGVHHAASSNQGGALNAASVMRMTTGTNYVSLNVNRIDTSVGYWNVEYVHSDTPNGTGISKINEVLSTSSNITWTSQGSMTLEIQ